MPKKKKKKRETRLVYKDDRVSLFVDTYNYILVIDYNRHNYGSLRGLFSGLLRKKIKTKLGMNSFKDVEEFRAIHEKALREVKDIAINMVDWK